MSSDKYDRATQRGWTYILQSASRICAERGCREVITVYRWVNPRPIEERGTPREDLSVPSRCYLCAAERYQRSSLGLAPRPVRVYELRFHKPDSGIVYSRVVEIREYRELLEAVENQRLPTEERWPERGDILLGVTLRRFSLPAPDISTGRFERPTPARS